MKKAVKELGKIKIEISSRILTGVSATSSQGERTNGNEAAAESESEESEEDEEEEWEKKEDLEDGIRLYERSSTTLDVLIGKVGAPAGEGGVV